MESGSHGDIQPKTDFNGDLSRKPVLIMTPYTMTPCYGAMVSCVMVSWCHENPLFTSLDSLTGICLFVNTWKARYNGCYGALESWCHGVTVPLW